MFGDISDIVICERVATGLGKKSCVWFGIYFLRWGERETHRLAGEVYDEFDTTLTLGRTQGGA